MFYARILNKQERSTAYLDCFSLRPSQRCSTLASNARQETTEVRVLRSQLAGLLLERADALAKLLGLGGEIGDALLLARAEAGCRVSGGLVKSHDRPEASVLRARRVFSLATADTAAFSADDAPAADPDTLKASGGAA